MIILQVGNQFPSCFESLCDIMAPVDQKHQNIVFTEASLIYHIIASYSTLLLFSPHFYILATLLYYTPCF